MTHYLSIGAVLAILVFILLVWQWVDILPDAPTGEPEPPDWWEE